MQLDKVLKKIKYVVFDTDGTTTMDGKPLEFAKEALAAVRAAGKKAVFFTNDTSLGERSLAQTLTDMGVGEEDDVFMTAGGITAEYIKENYPGAKCLVAGTSGLAEDLTSRGVQTDAENPDVVVLGDDPELTYAKLKKAISALNRGATLISASPDACVMTGDGAMPACGAWAEMAERVTGVKPAAVPGKPDVYAGDKLLEKLGCNPDEILIVGDSLTSDVAFGVNCGFYTMAVLTGLTDERLIRMSDTVPDITLPDLKEMAEWRDDA